MCIYICRASRKERDREGTKEVASEMERERERETGRERERDTYVHVCMYVCVCMCIGRHVYVVQSLWNAKLGDLCTWATTARGFEPLRAEPNGFRVHLLSRSDTLSSFAIHSVY